ncbi:MAG TPA: sigma factor [Hyphomicrobiaceae bacterium]|nr:sigma factor [Hyphomicrobiaceae bacterium]
MSELSDFERLTRPHLDAAFNLAIWLVRSAPDAEDIVQESYMRAFRAFHGFTGTDAKPWLLGHRAQRRLSLAQQSSAGGERHFAG